jgi:hypothetical protein
LPRILTATMRFPFLVLRFGRNRPHAAAR